MNDAWMRRKVIALWICLMALGFFGSWMWDRIRSGR